MEKAEKNGFLLLAGQVKNVIFNFMILSALTCVILFSSITIVSLLPKQSDLSGFKPDNTIIKHDSTSDN